MSCGKKKKTWPQIGVSTILALLPSPSLLSAPPNMPFRKISRDLKIAAVRLYERNLLPLVDILDCLQMSESTFYRVLNLWNNTGDVVRHTFGICSCPRILHFDDVHYLKQLVKACPDWFLDELLFLLETNRFISAHYTTVHRELIHANVSTKKLKKIASERNENLRADFIQHMAQYSPEQLGFLDEVSKDERTFCRRRGRSRKGTHAVKKGVFVRGRCFSAEGLLTINGMVSNTVVKGSMIRARFLEYLEFDVVSQISLTVTATLSLLLHITYRCHFHLHSQVSSVFLWWTMHAYIMEKAFWNCQSDGAHFSNIILPFMPI